MPNGYEGFAKLGDVLLGGPQARAQANAPKYYEEAARANRAGHDALKALEEARIATAQRIARENLPKAIAGDAALAGHGDLASAILGMSTGQPNLGTFTEGLADLSDMEIDRQIREKLDAGDVAGAQRLSAVKTDKVLPSLEAAGKVVFTPVTGDIVTTPLGDAEIGADQALVTQRQAAASRDLARADLYGRTDPNKPRATGGKLGFQVEQIEADLGRDLTPRELQDLAAGKLDIQVPLGDVEPAAPPSGVSEAEVLQAIKDARAAIATGRITREEARKRLIAAGMTNAAGRI